MNKRTGRRKWLKTSIASAAGVGLSANLFAHHPNNINLGAKPTALVAGGGAMGSWSAYLLSKQGYDVTLLDPWGAGNIRASSGGESRLIRYLYGENEVYFRMAVRAMELWKQEEANLGKQLLYQTGMLIFSEMPTYDYAEISKLLYEKAGFPLEKIPAADLKKQYPFIETSDLNHAIYDPAAGYVLARESCRTLSQAVAKQGGKVIPSTAKPAGYANGQSKGVQLADGTVLQADVYVFATGPWLQPCFPEVFTEKLQVTRQPVFFFGPPADFASQLKKPFPVWMNRDKADQERSYGVYDLQAGTFKFAYTQLEEQEMDPTHDNRRVSEQEIDHARYLMGKRFTFMKNTPLVDAKVCQHTNTPDKNFILDQHPEAKNLWIAGGGSGHAFKHGPAIGEMVVKSLQQNSPVEPSFAISRLAGLEAFTTRHK